jgi:hypothetical protein
LRHFDKVWDRQPRLRFRPQTAVNTDSKVLIFTVVAIEGICAIIPHVFVHNVDGMFLIVAWYSSSSGRTIGGGPDLLVSRQCNTSTSLYTYGIGNTYTNNSDVANSTLFTGSSHFNVKEFEAFEIRTYIPPHPITFHSLTQRSPRIVRVTRIPFRLCLSGN